MSNIDWKQVYAHVVVGFIAALAVFTSLSADQKVTWHVWVAAVSAFLVATGGSATTSGGITTTPAIPEVLIPQATFVGPDTAPTPGAADPNQAPPAA